MFGSPLMMSLHLRRIAMGKRKPKRHTQLHTMATYRDLHQDIIKKTRGEVARIRPGLVLMRYSDIMDG